MPRCLLLVAVIATPFLPCRAQATGDANPFAFMLGNWRGTITSHESDGRNSSIEIHWTGEFVLDGRAIRTDWRIPLPNGRSNVGTMWRFFDSKQQGWRVAEIYTPDITLHVFRAEVVGSEVVQHGEQATPAGTMLTRRTFFGVTADQYENRYEVSSDSGRTWVERSRSVVRRVR